MGKSVIIVASCGIASLSFKGGWMVFSMANPSDVTFCFELVKIERTPKDIDGRIMLLSNVKQVANIEAMVHEIYGTPPLNQLTFNVEQ